MPLLATDVYDVLIAFIAAIPATIGAMATFLLVRRTNTPSGTAIGKQVESAHHVALANHYRIRALASDLNANVPVEVEREDAQARPPDG